MNKRTTIYALLTSCYLAALIVKLNGEFNIVKFVAAPGYLYCVWILFVDFRFLFFGNSKRGPKDDEPAEEFFKYLREAGLNVLILTVFMYSFYI